MVTKTALFIWCGISWIAVTIADMICGGIIGLLAGGIIGLFLAILVKLFSLGRFPKDIVEFAKTVAIIGAIVYAILGLFEFFPGHSPK